MKLESPHVASACRARAFTLAAISLLVFAGGCAIEPPPANTEVRKDALGEVKLDQPWKASNAIDANPVQDDWLSTFNDPALDALVREAIANNPDLRVAAARVEQAEQYLVVAKSALRPSLALFGTGGTKTGGGGDATSALQALVLGASWELDLWGRLRYARNAAAESYASARADFEFARQSLAAATAKAWFTATQYSLTAALAEQTAEASTRLESLAQDRERVGAGTPTETASARATARQAAGFVQQARFARGKAQRALEVLIGRYPSAELSARTEFGAMPGPMPVGVPLQMLERRPDVIAAERRVAAAFNRIGEAKAARLPQINLSLNLGAFESEVLELREDYENPSGGLGARLLAPLYQGGALKAQVEIRTLEQKEAIADYARVALNALAEVEDALAANESLAARAALQAEAVAEQERALQYSRTRLQVGRGDERAVEQQRLILNDAHSELITIQTDALVQRANLHLALGGSFDKSAP